MALRNKLFNYYNSLEKALKSEGQNKWKGNVLLRF